MNEKKTEELNQILGKTHISDFGNYCKEQNESILNEANSFPTYMKNLIRDRGLTQQVIFIRADIPERYGYKLLSGEKTTRQRDVILRICYAADFSLQETQRALRKYGMPELYAKIPRDALIMIMFNERPGSIIDVNTLLKEHGMEPLRTSGSQD